jgi:hypothetical protein
MDTMPAGDAVHHHEAPAVVHALQRVDGPGLRLMVFRARASAWATLRRHPSSWDLRSRCVVTQPQAFPLSRGIVVERYVMSTAPPPTARKH